MRFTLAALSNPRGLLTSVSSRIQIVHLFSNNESRVHSLCCGPWTFYPFPLHSTIFRHLFHPFPKVLDPEKQADLLDSLRICLLQFSTLLVEHAPHHIHDNNKSRNSKLRRLMTFAWPCLLPKACVDPACKYSGHLLLAHIIAKFAIHKKIVLQVSGKAERERRNEGQRSEIKTNENRQNKQTETEMRWQQMYRRRKKYCY